MIILVFLGLSCLSAAGGILLYRHLTDRHSQETLEALRASAEDYLSVEPPQEPPVPPPDSAPEETVSEEEIQSTPEPTATPEPLENPYQDSFLANEDMAAWLVVPDTRIDYPVMWTPRDENYYLRRGFDGQADQNGCLILDTDSCVDPLTTNLIIHGHNMKSGAMFGDLDKYQEESFFAYRNESAQEFRFVISEQIRQQIFFASLLQNIETNIKSSLLMKALKRWIQQQCFHLYKL